MSGFELGVLCWLFIVTILVIRKKGSKGDKGDSAYSSYVSTYQIKDASLELLDDSEYMKKVIQTVNSFQLGSGEKVGE
jgi:hypothetical protein